SHARRLNFCRGNHSWRHKHKGDRRSGCRRRGILLGNLVVEDRTYSAGNRLGIRRDKALLLEPGQHVLGLNVVLFGNLVDAGAHSGVVKGVLAELIRRVEWKLWP